MKAKTPTFTKEEWAEIYYALETKREAIRRGDFGPQEKRGANRQWISQLAYIQKCIEECDLI